MKQLLPKFVRLSLVLLNISFITCNFHSFVYRLRLNERVLNYVHFNDKRSNSLPYSKFIPGTIKIDIHACQRSTCFFKNKILVGEVNLNIRLFVKLANTVLTTSLYSFKVYLQLSVSRKWLAQSFINFLNCVRDFDSVFFVHFFNGKESGELGRIMRFNIDAILKLYVYLSSLNGWKHNRKLTIQSDP